MTVRIEAGNIIEFIDSKGKSSFRRFLSVTDDTECGAIMSRTICAKTKEELEIIDHENFREE